MNAPTIVCKKCSVATLLSTWTSSKDGVLDCPNCWCPHTVDELEAQTQKPATSPMQATSMKIKYGAAVTVPHPSRSFANSRPTIEIELDCHPDDRDATFNFMKDWVHTAIKAAIQELHGMQS